jgi:hypothetical protein
MNSAMATLDLIPFFTEMLKRIFEAVAGLGTIHDARSLEAYAMEQCKALAVVILELGLRLRAQSLPVPVSKPCACGHVQHHKGKRPRDIRTTLGTLSLDERHYYHCDHCNAGTYLGDELRGSTNFSPLAEDHIAWMGKEGAFEQAAKNLKHLNIFDVAASTVRDICNRLGKVVRERIEHQAAQQHCSVVKPEEKPKRLGIAVDGVMLGRIDPQHRKRKSKKGKVRGKTALEHFFHEVKTLVVFEFDKAGEALRQTYHATQDRIEDFREMVSLEAQKRGAQMADVVVFVGDGALWVWKTAETLFPNAIQVLDWYHAMEHVWAVGRAKFGSKEKELRAWVTARETELYKGKVQALIDAIRAVSTELGTPDEKLSDQARALDPRWIADRNIGYFEDNRERVNYPMYREQGLPIGSGMVESACKHVVASRCKQAGMRWDESGAENILALRCQALNDRWDTAWEKQAA